MKRYRITLVLFLLQFIIWAWVPGTQAAMPLPGDPDLPSGTNGKTRTPSALVTTTAPAVATAATLTPAPPRAPRAAPNLTADIWDAADLYWELLAAYAWKMLRDLGWPWRQAPLPDPYPGWQP